MAGWFGFGSNSRHHSSSRPGYARSYAGSSYSGSSSRHHSGTSRYKRSPREGYVSYLYNKFRHLLHKLWAYARRHPFKVFFMVIMPLVSGGVLHKLARQFGVNLPEAGGRGAGGARGGFSQGSYYGSEGYGRDGGGGMGGGMGGMGGQIEGISKIASGLGGLASIAKMAQNFM